MSEYGKYPKILYTKVPTKWHVQTVQTRIRLLQKEQSYKSLHGFTFLLDILRNNCIKSKIKAKKKKIYIYTERKKKGRVNFIPKFQV